MNYEEKYNEILEWARKNKARLNGVPIEEVLPELAESEDERIRKELIETIRCISSDCQYAIFLSEQQKQRYLAYLEKQKETLHISEMCKENGDSLTDDIIEVRSFQRGIEEGRRLEKQKEQKPEWSEEDEKILDSLIRLYSKEYSAYAWPWANGAFTYGDVVKFLKSLRPSWKPSEVQLNYLLMLADYFESEGSTSNAKSLRKLYEQLKKL